jgi:CheY-like chemotaxis protein
VTESGKTTLLVIDDDTSVCRAIRRLFKGRFNDVVFAETPADAETILASRAVTHVICDHMLGPGRPQGLELASEWKAMFPSIRKVIILTGANVKSFTTPPGIDLVLPKTIDPEELAAKLGA